MFHDYKNIIINRIKQSRKRYFKIHDSLKISLNFSKIIFKLKMSYMR